ncbi:hypothetical protein G6F42_025920 [Rhizopus arrhizus]|nr:hypothetical protein G6F42_025920 [Rhizopus arrhizus]
MPPRAETKDITVVADAENDTSPANTSTSIDTAVTNKVAKQENTKEKEAKELAAKAKENKLNDASDIMQGEKDASIKDSDDAAAANRAPDHAVVSPTEPMDIDEPVNASANKKKKSAKEPARNGKKRKGKKPVIPQESEDKEDGEEIDEEMPEYEVENIAGHRVFKGKVVKYVVKWKGYPSSENTIENAITMHDDVPELCAAYWAACKEKIPDNVPQREG